MKKQSLVDIEKNFDIKLEDGDIIKFNMPEYCTGTFEAIVKTEPEYGFLYINEEQDHFEDCISFKIIRNEEEL